jgi:hypothetical protein
MVLYLWFRRGAILFAAVSCIAFIYYATVEDQLIFGLANIILFGGLFGVVFASQIMAVTQREWGYLATLVLAIALGWLIAALELDGGLLEALVSSVIICIIATVAWLALERLARR